MGGTVTPLARAALVASGVGLGVLGYRVRGRDEPAADSFAALMVVLGVTAVLLGVAGPGLPMYMVSWLLAFLAIPLALAVFGFEYYGLEGLSSRGRLAAFLSPAVLGGVGGTLVILGEPKFGGGSGPAVAAVANLPAPTLAMAHALHEVGLFYAGGVMLVATGLVLSTVGRYEHLDTGLGAVLSFVGVWPWLAYLVTLALPQSTSLPVLAACYLASLGASTFALVRYRPFEAAPAAGNVGPEAVLAGMDDAVVVVDRDERVVRLNDAACRTFGVERAAVVGGPLEALLDADLATLRASNPFTVATAEGKRGFEASVSGLIDPRGRRRGAAIVLHDVTERRTREQRLEVLNRVLRHNLRNDMSAIIGHADVVEAGDLDPGEAAEGIRAAADGLVALGERAREVEEMMSVPRRLGSRTDLAPTVEAVVADVAERYPDVEYSVAVPPALEAGVDERILRPVLDNVVENAAEHNDAEDPRVEVSARVEAGATPPVELAVADDGPGIPDHERAVLSEGDETPLEHGSGLGLWAVHWGVRRMGGELDFADADPRGTVVRIGLPAPADATPGDIAGGAAAGESD